jgi:hypothetical protein
MLQQDSAMHRLSDNIKVFSRTPHELRATFAMRASLVAGALREISVGLCRGNFFMYRACLGGGGEGSGRA